jgi:hypothetical protein
MTDKVNICGVIEDNDTVILPMTTEMKVANLLAILGDTPDKIAEKLLGEGCFGNKIQSCSCPVAIWFQKHDMYVSVGVTNVTIYEPFVSVDPPKPVKVFVSKFDLREYPFLESKVCNL